MDLSLTEEQSAFRALARDFLEKEAVPHRQQWDRDESVDLGDHPEDGRDRVLRAHHPRGVRRPRRRLRHLRDRHGGARPGRLRVARHRLGLQRPGRQVDPRLRHRGAEAGVAAGHRDGREARLLRPDRARHRLRRRQPHDEGDQGRRRLRPQRAEAVHHQRHLGRRGAGLRAHVRRRPARRDGVPRADRHRRLRGPRDQGQARAARPGDRRALPGGRPGAGVRAARRRGPGLQDRDEQPRQGAGLGGRRLRRAGAGLPRVVGRRTPRSGPSSAARSPASSWSRT